MSVRARVGLLVAALIGGAIGLACATPATKPVKREGEGKASGNAPSAEEAIAPFFPLAVGNAWTYRIQLMGERRRDRIEIGRAEGGWFYDNKGSAFRIDREGLRTKERYLLKAPLVRGNHWSSVLSLTSTEHYEIEETGVTVAVPAGTFHGCVVVRARNRMDDRTTMFKEDSYCPGVGLVRVRTWVDVAGKGTLPQAELRLEGFSRALGTGG